MALEAVLFDYGDTLLSMRMNWRRVVPAQIQNLARALRPGLPGVDFNRLGRDFLFLRAEALKRADVSHVETSALACLRTALGLQGLEVPDEELLQRGVDGFFGPEEEGYSLIVGVPETLQKLTGLGLKLGLITNATCGHLIRRSLERFRLAAFFDSVVVSCEVGRRKPAPEAFAPALEALGVSAGATAMVGDRRDKDIAGANLAGLLSVLVDFFGEDKNADEGPPWPDLVVRHPEALVEAFEAWMK